ncbi:unnamed protein product [Rhizoctonia solani]|uniref:Exonuclease domain-containing protein n=1 Tax=Rhizoctonia solani TaxID=456999 RepID=A0A8H3C0V8_9AGAM|nr:unnamed protein product [Rhizoctonia solani]
MSTIGPSSFSYSSASTSLYSSNTSVSAEPKIYPPERYRALSCLAVGAGAGGSVNMLAKVTVVDYWGNEMMEAFVRPTEPVVDYRTAHTGITEENLDSPQALPFDVVQAKVTDLISGYIIIGHTLWNDLSVLGICHLAINTRDIALYLPFRKAIKQEGTPGLPTLVWIFMGSIISYFAFVVWIFMGRYIHCGTSDSTENARACMDLFRSTEHNWEQSALNGNWPCALPPVGYARYFH